MDTNDETIVMLLNEIKDLLIPISAHFEQEYIGTKRKELEEILSTNTKRKIFSLLFDVRNLSQTEIAKEANTTQPTVSRLIASLLESNFIEKHSDPSGKDYYSDKYKLSKRIEGKDGKLPEQ